MCGRYALGIRASYVRYQMQQQGLQVDDAPADEDVRETYNFPPGAYGLVYRADAPDTGGSWDNADSDISSSAVNVEDRTADELNAAGQTQSAGFETASDLLSKSPAKATPAQKYQLKAMKWGLIPFWTKRSPDYGSMLRTINCRDDSLIEDRGMWNTMKQRKRCLVIAQGFFEWLKPSQPGGRKTPHFVKRSDSQLMLMAGLWDCVQYEDGPDSGQKLYTYSIITTDSNRQLKFLHDRMPVILTPGTPEIALWLNPKVKTWSSNLQSMLKPFEGELECYPVDNAVGKVGNNSESFIVPVDSKENKKNIANFFANATSPAKKANSETRESSEYRVSHDAEEERKTIDHNGTENDAPMPVPADSRAATKRRFELDDHGEPEHKTPKLEHEMPRVKREAPPNTQSPPERDSKPITPVKPNTKQVRSATSNEFVAKKLTPVKADGSQRITSFFGKT